MPLSVEQKLKLAQLKSDAGTRTAAKGVSCQKTEKDIERQRRRLEAEKAQEIFQKRQLRYEIAMETGTSLIILVFILVMGTHTSDCPVTPQVIW